jgi:transcriptional regulator with XRE-family HTH domain
MLAPHNFERHVLPVAREMPRQELAEAVGMTERGLRKILNGHSDGTPTSRTAITIASGDRAARRLERRPSTPVDDCAAWLARRQISP